jgi:hypothetical protein
LFRRLPGDKKVVQIRKVIQRRIRRSGQGVDVFGDVSAAISANVGERSSTSHVSSRSTVSAHTPEKEERRDGTEGQGRTGA